MSLYWERGVGSGLKISYYRSSSVEELGLTHLKPIALS